MEGGRDEGWVGWGEGIIGTGEVSLKKGHDVLVGAGLVEQG